MAKTVIAFAAHPDDFEFTCTGKLYKIKDEGYELIYIIVTNGENGFKTNPYLEPKERINIRKKEQLESANKLGVKNVVFLDFSDGFVNYSDTENIRKQAVEIIKKYKPEIVFSIDPANRQFDNLNVFHRDHRIVAEAVFDACFAAKNLYMYPGEPHMIKKICFYGTNQPNYFEDITDLIEFKLELLACHRSQFPDFGKVADYIKNTYSKATDRYEYSEPFRILEVAQIS